MLKRCHSLLAARSAWLLFVFAAVLSGCGTNVSVTNLQLTLTPATLGFGIAGLNTASAAQSLTLTNTGMAAATITATTVSGDFSIAANSCGSTLTVGATCQISVVFTPASLGLRTGSVTVASNAGPQTATLTGTGGTSLATFAPASVNFRSVAVGGSSAAQTVTITSSGTAALALSSILPAGDFSETANSCTAVLAAGASCQVTLVFTPRAFGVRSGTLTLASNSGSSPQAVVLSGTGTTPASYAGSSFSVTVKAGAQPVAGAAVQLYAAGTNGNGSAGSVLLASPIVTGAAGSATIPAGFVCPGAGSLLYLVSSGGTVGLSPAANAGLKWMAAVGPCSSVAAGSTYAVDETTTVAAAYALAPFYVSGQIGASSSNIVGLGNAFLTAGTLADPVTGTSPGSLLPAQAVSPAARVNSVANMLNACAVNASTCGALFSATTVTTMPANTLDAAFNLAQHPAANVAALYGQSLLSQAYAPALTSRPADWTMFLTLSGGGLNSPSGIGVDASGSVWVASYFNAASKFSPVGAAQFPAGITGYGIDNSYGLAIDANNNVWIPNEIPFTATGIGSVTELSAAGAALSGSGGFQNGGLDYPLSVAIDPNGTVWVVDFGNSHLTLLDQLGTPLSGSAGYTTPLFAFPIVVAVDANHFGWVGNLASTFVTRVAPDGSSFVNFNCCNGAAGIALDQGNNVWIANYYGNSVSLIANTGIASTGTIVSAGAYTGLGSLERPQGIAVDGAGNVWVANYRMPYLTELAGTGSGAPGTSLSPAAGLGADAGLLEAYALAVDASGDVWVSNQGSNTVTKFIGLASPVKTPLSGLPQAP